MATWASRARGQLALLFFTTPLYLERSAVDEPVDDSHDVTHVDDLPGREQYERPEGEDGGRGSSRCRRALPSGIRHG